MKQTEKFAKTVDAAIQEALDELAVDIDDVVVEVLDEGEEGGLLGFGRRPAHVRVSLESDTRPAVCEMPCQDDRIIQEDPLEDSDFPESANWAEAQEGYDEEIGREDICDDFQADSKNFTGAAEVDNDAAFPTDNRLFERDLNPEEDVATTSNGRKEFTNQEKVEMEDKAVVFVASILQKLNVHGKISSYYADDGCLRIDVSGENLGIAIGRRGETLYAIQYLTTLVINQDHSRYQRVFVDIDHYRDRQMQKLRDRARRSADRVLSTGRRYVFPPMEAAERRQIHMALADLEGIHTHSEGRDPKRRVVVDLDKRYR